MDVNDSLLQKLREVASRRGITSYGHLVEELDLDMSSPADRRKIGEILGAISEEEHRRGRPMISAVVVGSETSLPGQGFFSLARRLGKLAGGNETGFFAEELRRVHDFWTSEEGQDV